DLSLNLFTLAQLLLYFACFPSEKFLVKFSYLAGHYNLSLRAQSFHDIFQGFHEPMGRFIKDLGSLRLPEAFQRRSPCAPLRWKKAAEVKIIGRQATSHRSREKRRCSRNRHDRNTMLNRQGDQSKSRIRNPWHSRVADHGNSCTLLELRNQLSRLSHLI